MALVHCPSPYQNTDLRFGLKIIMPALFCSQQKLPHKRFTLLADNSQQIEHTDNHRNNL